MIYYKFIKITIDTPNFDKAIIDMIIQHYRFSNSILSDCSLIFNLKFWFSLCYFLKYKLKLLTAFYP